MDPITAAAVSAILAPLVSGAAGEAGKQALDRLLTFVRGHFGTGPTAVERIAEDDVPRLGILLEQAAAGDEEIDGWLRDWLRSSAPLVGAPTEVSNIIAGQAQVSGTVIQAHTISGAITFGRGSGS